MSRLSHLIGIGVCICVATCAGCGSDSTPQERTPSRDTPLADRPLSKKQSKKKKTNKNAAAKDKSPGVIADAKEDDKKSVEKDRSLGQLLDDSGHKIFQGRFDPVDDELVKACGIRKLVGKYTTIYTDHPPKPGVDILPKVFDMALPLWCKYFSVPQERLGDFHLIGSIMVDRGKFTKAKLLNEFVPPFLHGYAMADRYWLLDQPSDYYRRHLMLHEGTHAFVRIFRGGIGPPWFAEGVAEFLGTHKYQDGDLELGYFPPSKQVVSHWGRVKIVKDDFKANKAMMLLGIMSYSGSAHLKVEPYGWCWAAANFFENHPQFQPMFRSLLNNVEDSSGIFSRNFYNDVLKANDPKTRQYFDVHQQWQLFVANMEYGYNLKRELIAQRPVQPVPAEGASVTIQADRGWQSSGFQLQSGMKYEVTATGQYEVAQDPKPWKCEPNGITLRYYRGKPLGLLVGAVAPEVLSQGMTPLAAPQSLGLKRVINVKSDGTFLLRINEFPNELSDNRGSLTVRIRPLAN